MSDKDKLDKASKILNDHLESFENFVGKEFPQYANVPIDDTDRRKLELWDELLAVTKMLAGFADLGARNWQRVNEILAKAVEIEGMK